jgi:hypothetical protein
MRAARASGDDVKDCRLQISRFRHETRMYAVAVSLISRDPCQPGWCARARRHCRARTPRARALAREAFQRA